MTTTPTAKGMRIVIDLKRDAIASDRSQPALLPITQMQTTFGVIMLAIVNGEPKILTLQADASRNTSSSRRRSSPAAPSLDLKKAQERAHILEGLKIARGHYRRDHLHHPRFQGPCPSAKASLMERFGFDDVQADAIVQMRAGTAHRPGTAEDRRRTGRAARPRSRITEDILADEDTGAGHRQGRSSWKSRNKYGDERRTEILPRSAARWISRI